MTTERHLILGTAGHIDHGKTSLVKALTGVDCDRLPEEKRRGITIDIGFAALDLGEFRVGIVDVPGHERFIKNMLAGSTGIDLALLVVAADDSVMPQTREHLDILKLLGLRHGVIALTRCDLVDDTTREVVELEVRDLVRGSFLADAPIIHTSAHTGAGLEALRVALADACRAAGTREDGDWFRLAIDRAFSVPGHGTIVTGSVTSGRLQVGDELEWLRGDATEKVRVRSLHSHDAPAGEVARGQRAAVNLAGVDLHDVRRGQELATPGLLRPSRVLTVRLHALGTDDPQSRRPAVKHRLQAHLHLGTAEVMATVSLLDADDLRPGQSGLAQLFADEAIVAAHGQPFVLRDAAAAHTLGGGIVLQPVARKVRRRHVEALEQIERLESADANTRALTAAWFAGTEGVAVADVARDAGLPLARAVVAIESLRTAGDLCDVHAGTRRLLVHRGRLTEIETRLFAALDRLHDEFPLLTAHDRAKVQAQLAWVGDDALVAGIVDRLLTEKRLASEPPPLKGGSLRLARAGFKPKLSANQRRLRERIIEAHREAGFQPPEPASFTATAGGLAGSLADLFAVCVAEGHLVQVAPDLYLHAEADAELRRRVTERLREVPTGLTVAEIRDLMGTTRKYAVPVCEYLDRAGVTRRDGDVRVLAG